MAAIDQVVARNAKEATPFRAPSSPRLCVVACDDAALSVQLDSVLGIEPAEMPIIRLPAACGALSDELIQRAVAKAVYVEGCSEVLLLTHSSCTLHGLRAEQLIDAMARAGVQPAAIPFDLRELVGAGRDPRQAVMDSANALRRCAFLPATLLVHVAHLDERTGSLQLLEHGASARVDRPPDSGESVSGYLAGPSQPIEASLPTFNIPIPDVPVIDTLPLAAVAPSLLPPPFAAEAPDLDRAAVEVIPVVQVAAANRRPPPVAKAPPPTSPKLQMALDAVRAFVNSDLPKKERQWVKAALTHAAEQGQSADALVKIALQPVLKSGNKRYRIIDELILVKDEVSKMSPARAFAILRRMVD